jgi:hypothetical protein
MLLRRAQLPREYVLSGRTEEACEGSPAPEHEEEKDSSVEETQSVKLQAQQFIGRVESACVIPSSPSTNLLRPSRRPEL